MRDPEKIATANDTLIALVGDAGVCHIAVRRGLTRVPPIHLPPGQFLSSKGDRIGGAFADRIAVFDGIVDGVYVDGVGNPDPVATCGVNGMAFNDRSAVDRQIVKEKISLHGPGGSGFANAGIANGARGYAPHPRIPEADMQRARRGADHD